MAAAESKPAGKAPKTKAGAAGKAASTSKPAGKAAPPPADKPPGRKSYWWLWLIPLIVVAAGAWFGYEYLADWPSRLEELEEKASSIEEMEDRIDELRQRLAEDTARQAADAQSARLAAERVRDALEVRLAAAERGLDSLGSRPAGSQDRWRLDAADRLLALADRQARFARDYEGAALAVREALELLAQVGDPRYGALRSDLQEQARDLESIPARDIQAVVVRLGALLSRTDGLKPDLSPATGEPAGPGGLPEEGWERAVASTRRAFRSLITVRRTENEVETLLTDADTQTLQRLLAAELHLARLAYIQGDLKAYAAALVAARGRLSRLYDSGDPDVTDTLADIDELLQLSRRADAPDIASSLQRLRNLRSG